ncbi:putative sodium-dependent multivitamin transporter [Macrobrachium nipponense]|uniref:putative sodium-dependent multivitamin transporter n=1 Tax=Macrobrachium nipponense TaxID=159736 RepID=UPI0030C7DCB4
MEKIHSYFGIVDYVIFALVLAMSSAIGIYFRFTGGRQKTYKEYMLADQSMPVLPVAFSLMASFMSAITILGVATENYVFGTQFVVINISYVIATPLACYVYLPVFFRLQNTSVYEYLERRFGLLTRTCASLAFSLQMALYMGIVLYAPALALSAVTGISLNWSIASVGVVCTFYSSLGGMKAVLVTDVFQSLLMFAAVFAVITRGLLDYGIQGVFAAAENGERLEFLNASLDPRERHTIWSLGIGGIFTYCSLYGVNQAQVQRLLTIKDLRRAQASLWLQLPILMLLSTSTSFAGLVLYAHYQNCDPMKSKRITNPDQLLPLYVVETMGMFPGLSGLFVSGIFSGSLSTVSSALNSLAAVTLQDYVLPFVSNRAMVGEKLTLISKFLALLYGCICLAIAFMTQFLGSGILEASLKIFGAVGGPLLAVFTMGMLFKKANQKGAMVGLVCGLIITMWIAFGKPKPPPHFKPVSVEGCANNVNSTLKDWLSVGTTIAPVDVWDFENITLENSTYDQDVLSSSSFLSLLSEEGNSTDRILMKSAVPVNLTTVYYPKSGFNETNPDGQKSKSFLLNLYALSYMWVAGIGFFITLTVGLLVSLATGGNDILDEDLYSSWVIPLETSPNDESAYLEKSDIGNETELHPVCSQVPLTAAPREITKL